MFSSVDRDMDNMLRLVSVETDLEWYDGDIDDNFWDALENNIEDLENENT